MRLIGSAKTKCGEVKAYYVHGNEEYVVRVFRKAKHYAPADYFTDDKADALATMQAMAIAEDKIADSEG